MASAFGAGAGADMLQDVLRRKFQEAFAQQQLAEQIRRANIVDARERARDALLSEDRKAALAERSATQLSKALTPEQTLTPETSARLRAGGLGDLVRRDQADIPSLAISGIADTGAATPTLRAVRISEAGRPERETFTGTADQLAKQEALNETRRTRAENEARRKAEDVERAKPASQREFEYAKTQGFKGTFEDYQNIEANRRKPSVTVSTSSAAGSDADAIADAIMAGNQPPVTTGLYRNAGPVRAALARKGYNLAQANLDYDATKRHLATLNGQQQLRIGQAVETASHALDVIDSLAEQWNGSKFPLLNRANLALATNGAYGADAQKVATQLQAQINDLTSELGQVYMGGNSPTDHALKLAGKNLSADWSKDTLKTMTDLARKNLQIRRNSMQSVGVAGASAGNPYVAQTATSTPVAGGKRVKYDMNGNPIKD